MKQLSLGAAAIGPGARPFIIAEVGQAHDGSLGAAHAYIELAREVGVDAIKFQTHIAREESTRDEQFRVKFSYQDATRYDYWQRMEFTPEQWQGLYGHAREAGLEFLSTPFSVAALEMLDAIGVPAWKVGSGEVFNDSLFEAMRSTNKPVLLSTGMSSWQDIADAVKVIEGCGLGYALFQCTSSYPVSLDKVGLNVMQEMRERFRCPVGLSDHSGGVHAGIAALARGADMLEAHIVFDKRCFGPDAPSSLTPDGFASVVRFRDALWEMDSNPVDKDAVARDMKAMRKLFSKSVTLREDMPEGTVLTREMLTLKKPGEGFAPDQLPALVGKRLGRDVRCDRLLRPEDIDE